jgi:hypothetical protein
MPGRKLASYKSQTRADTAVSSLVARTTKCSDWIPGSETEEQGSYFPTGRRNLSIVQARYSDWLRTGQPTPSRGKTFLHSTSFRSILGPTQPSVQWLLEDFSPEKERPERESNDSPPTNVEVKNMWIYTSTPLCVFMA